MSGWDRRVQNAARCLMTLRIIFTTTVARDYAPDAAAASAPVTTTYIPQVVRFATVGCRRCLKRHETFDCGSNGSRRNEICRGYVLPQNWDTWLWWYFEPYGVDLFTSAGCTWQGMCCYVPTFLYVCPSTSRIYGIARYVSYSDEHTPPPPPKKILAYRHTLPGSLPSLR